MDIREECFILVKVVSGKVLRESIWSVYLIVWRGWNGVRG